MNYQILFFLISFSLMILFCFFKIKYSEELFDFFKLISSFLVFSITRDYVVNTYEVGVPLWFFIRNILPFVIAIIFWKFCLFFYKNKQSIYKHGKEFLRRFH